MRFKDNVLRIFRAIRTAILPRRGSGVEIVEDETCVITTTPGVTQLSDPTEVPLQVAGGPFCQALSLNEETSLYANAGWVPDPSNSNEMFELTKGADQSGDETFFWLKNLALQGYVGLTTDNKAFTIFSEKQDCCRLKQPGGSVIRVFNTSFYMMVDDNDKSRIVATPNPQQATQFNSLGP